VILDLHRFVADERPYWDELDAAVRRLEETPGAGLDVESVRRLHYLYERAAADLARVATFAHQPELRSYLDALVARAYGQIHESARRRRLPVWTWLTTTFPCTFRRHGRAFRLACAATGAGAAIGALLILALPDAKRELLPFEHLLLDPSERVRIEEAEADSSVRDAHAQFSAFLMTHNIRVSVLCMALGMTFGVGTLVLLFTNGVLLGAVAADYLAAGQGMFLGGWLLPHGVVEIPAVLLAAQAGLVLASALIGRASALPLRHRLSAVRDDLVTLILGAALLLVWAGLIESFVSQYHAPVLPYGVKIGMGVGELALLVVYLGRAGRRGEARAA
jgi:uncharacterized membrane protein SpoIIM required for sporulation